MWNFFKNLSKLFGCLILLVFAFLLPAKKTFAAVLFIQSTLPNASTVAPGQSFSTNWFLDTQGENLNALSLKIKFPNAFLQSVGISSARSLITFWVQQPTVSNSGEIALAGGVPNGFNGSQIPIFTASFKVKNSQSIAGGQALSFALDPGSEVLKNDGLGSVAALSLQNFVLDVVGSSGQNYSDIISSPTNPDQNIWYRNHEVLINFQTAPGQQYSYSFSSNINAVPDNQPAKLIGSLDYKNIPDGLYYFKLDASDHGGPWQNIGLFLVRIDSAPPEPFTPTIQSDPIIFGGRKFLNFSASDKISGIEKYSVKLGMFGNLKDAAAPMLLSRPLIGDSISVFATDQAGNVRVEKVAYPGFITTKVFYVGILALVLLLVYIFELILRRRKLRR